MRTVGDVVSFEQCKVSCLRSLSKNFPEGLKNEPIQISSVAWFVLERRGLEIRSLPCHVVCLVLGGFRESCVRFGGLSKLSCELKPRSTKCLTFDFLLCLGIAGEG